MSNNEYPIVSEFDPVIKLKPCPFCGGNAQLIVNEGVRVSCFVCKASTRVQADSELFTYAKSGASAVVSVIRAWNRRDTANAE